MQVSSNRIVELNTTLATLDLYQCASFVFANLLCLFSEEHYVHCVKFKSTVAGRLTNGKLQATSALITAVIIQFGFSVWAEDFDEGKFEFNWACATCHGIDAKGKGPLSSDQTMPPADLTVLAKKNNGAFPLTQVYEVIDGRKVIEAHGARQMPIWGALNSRNCIRRIS